MSIHLTGKEYPKVGNYNTPEKKKQNCPFNAIQQLYRNMPYKDADEDQTL